MKKTLLILFVLFLFLSGCERAPLIEDYKIENISLGDSLNDLMSKNEIEEQIVKSKTQFDYRGDDFASIYLPRGSNHYFAIFIAILELFVMVSKVVVRKMQEQHVRRRLCPEVGLDGSDFSFVRPTRCLSLSV